MKIFRTEVGPAGGGGGGGDLTDGSVQPKHLDWRDPVASDGSYIPVAVVDDGSLEPDWAVLPVSMIAVLLSPPETGTYILRSTDGELDWMSV